MSLSAKRHIYGIHSITPYNPISFERYGTLETLGAGSFSITQAINVLRGGSLRVPWAAELGDQEASLTLTMREYPDFIFELFMGKAPTAVAASATGSISALANKKGTSVMSATNGISDVAITSGKNADLKAGLYVIKTTGSQAFDVYGTSNVDFSRGENVEFVDDTLKLTATPLSVAAGTVSMDDFGLDFTAVGVPNFTVGDTAYFRVKPINDGSSSVIIGGIADIAPEFGAILVAQKRGDASLCEIDVFKCRGGGMNIGANEKAFAETPITATAFYDTVRGGVAEITNIKGA